MIRLFVGIPLPDAVRERLGVLRAGIPGARWVEPDNLHVSLRFIGEVDAGVAEDIDDALTAIRAPAFTLAVAGVGCFESAGKVHTLWAGLEPLAPLAHLRDKVESAIVRTGLEPERRKFKPHVTLARLKNTPHRKVGTFLEGHNTLRAGPFPVATFALIRSHLNRDGPHYEPVADYALVEANGSQQPNLASVRSTDAT